MSRSQIPLWLSTSIVLTALLSLWSISYRYRAEERNRAVSIAVEYETIEAYAAAQGKTIDDALFDLKKQGLGSVVLSEEYFADLLNSGRATLSEGSIQGIRPQDGQRAFKALTIRFPSMPTQWDGHGVQFPGVSAATVRSTPVGLNPEQAATIRKAGLAIIARMANPPGVSADYVRKTIDWAHDLGAGIFLPMGDQVLGRREALKDMTDELERVGMLYASPEFSKLGGDENVLQTVPQSVVRLHSAQSAELDKLRLDEAVERYSLAARERGMRVLLVRPISFASAAPLGSLDEFVKRINLDCRRQGLDMGDARPFFDPNVPVWLFLLIGLSIAPVAYFAGAVFIQNRAARVVGAILAFALGAIAVTNHGRPFTALLGALAFPTVAFLVLDARSSTGFPPVSFHGRLARENAGAEASRPAARTSFWDLVLAFVLVSLISLVGGLAVAGLLNSLPYFIRAQQFEGVKLAVFLPIALVALYFLMRGTDVRAALKNPMTWGSAVIALVVLGALAFMSSRTGNDNPAGVSDLELKMRFLLDQILFVRPRTKEFMVGHPLLIIGIGLLIAQKRRPNPTLAVWTALALAGGAIGQTDIVNTMCHIHTPVVLSLMRIGVGMVAGCIIGLAVWAIAKRWLPAGDL